jgi:tRNA dimethylallyltransferase
LLIVAGPTASGKTALAVELAVRLGGEIISADSRQIYRRLDVGTAKPDAEERCRASHHLLDIVDVGERYSAGRFARDARQVLERIESSGKVPIICGGTGFYIDALVRPMFTEPDVDPVERNRIRAELAGEAARYGRQVLHQRLQEIDPHSAARLHPNDFQRVSRALELFILTGSTMSELHAEAQKTAEFTPFMVLLEPEAQWHESRIAGRAGWMLDNGWVEEVRGLLAEGVSGKSPGMESLGYAEVLQLVGGEIDLEQAGEIIALKTRQYARRQRTWFKARGAALSIDPRELDLKQVLSAWSDFEGESATRSDR